MRRMHPVISTLFDPRSRPGFASRSAAPRPVVDAGPYAVSGRLTSAPWEGLYVEGDD